MNLDRTNNKEIIQALPHKVPFIMVDELLYMDANKTIAKLFITEDNVFSKNGFFQEPGIMEHVAQSTALRPTLEAAEVQQDAPLGYFAAIKNFKLYELPPVNSVIETTSENVVVVKTAIKVNTRSTCNGKLICESEMLFYLNS
ncbi:3-hydroxyacyl-[acyl-carrier-protein] dehydratase FabZ [Kordia antarctica]|uniref:3-hydroxyacyl-[acyl-carrier-protein] dehydratase FabZ n=1 Tax=Kordia antarctica TaxID=1218801 RepID=A0A7L4ZJV6_9FLAO|nr:hypothetical protein [Kordia antarctica]QHI36905.1 3-hydroxyacyl-[acyl-carrier-protein] dehydratase FabZ [Kordia antarctica]